MIYDYRIYTAPNIGEMPMAKRVIGEFMETFAKYDMRVIGVWTPIVSENNLTVHFMLEYRDFKHWETAWSGYKSDAEAQRKFVDSFDAQFTWLENVSNCILEPTDFSPQIYPSQARSIYQIEGHGCHD